MRHPISSNDTQHNKAVHGLVLVILCIATQALGQSFGKFSEEPRTLWLTEIKDGDRRMRLLADFWFDDVDGKRWLTPTAYVVDGASIPRALWTLVGSPYTGCYRRASIVHDKACDDAG